MINKLLDRSGVREFWINDNAEGDGTKSWSESPWFGYVHVIEYSAYAALQAECERLKESNITLNKMLDASGLSQENQALRELLRECKDTIVFFDNECDVLDKIEVALKDGSDE